MVMSVILILIAVLIVIIWLFIEFKRMRHKIFALFLIGLIIFLYFSASSVLKDKNIDYKSFSGVKDAFSIYFSWLGSIFSNVKTVTSNAISMNWSGNKTGS